MKNALLLFVSPIQKNRETNMLTQVSYAVNGGENISAVQANEAAIKYMMQQLAAQGETVDKVFAFVSNMVSGKQGKKFFYVDEAGQEHQGTYQQLFEELLVAQYPQLEGNIVYIPYDEDDQQRNANDYVLNMVQEIQGTLAYPPEWRIHVDLAGGLRHAAVTMMSVVHLLKYTGLEIGQVVYANYSSQPKRMEDVTELHRMYELVSSTDSLLNSANIQHIIAYFKEVKCNRVLKNLLKALEDFTDDVRVCRTGAFNTDRKQLIKALANFKQYPQKNTQELLFSKILTVLEKDYAEILRTGSSRENIIRWCLSKDFLQQAMTLFNEWVPLILVEDKIYYPYVDYAEHIEAHCRKKIPAYKTWQSEFVRNYNISSPIKLYDILGEDTANVPSHIVCQRIQVEERAWDKSIFDILPDMKKLQDVISNSNRIKNMLKKNMAQTQYNWDDVIEMVHTVWWVAKQRNNMNHASAKAEAASSEEVRQVLAYGLDLLRRMKQQRKASAE